MSRARWCLFAVLVALLVAAGVAIVASQRAADGSHGLLRHAATQMQEGRHDGAAASARELLRRAPAHGQAFGLLAQALEGEGGEAADLARYETAARRTPRDPRVRAWLATHHLRAGDFPAAIGHLHALHTVAPTQRRQVMPLLVQLSRDPVFADALAAYAASRPQWRAAVLRAAVASRDMPEAADNLHGALRRQGMLTPEEINRWIDGMLAGGRWGTAYARWYSGLDDPPAQLPVPWNGDFSAAPTSTGFDWRVRRTTGVVFDRIALADGGHGARLSFHGRQVGDTGLQVPLLLAPGRYRLTMRARAEGLRSEQGLSWVILCAGGPRRGEGLRLRPASGWSRHEYAFEVPPERCDGQWLRLVNPAPAGFAQVLRGEVQFANIAVTPSPEDP